MTELTGNVRCPKPLVGCDGDLFTLDREDDRSHVVCRLDDTSTGSMIPVFSVDEDCSTLRATRNHELLLVFPHQLVLFDQTGDLLRVINISNMQQRDYAFSNSLQICGKEDSLLSNITPRNLASSTTGIDDPLRNKHGSGCCFRSLQK